MKIHSVLTDRPVVFTLRRGGYILGSKYAALWECDCLAGKIKAEAWKEDREILLVAKYIE